MAELRRLFGHYPGAEAWEIHTDEPAAQLAESMALSAGCEFYTVDGRTYGPFVDPQKVGENIGRAIARDVLADHLPREWSGIDPQDAEQFASAGLVPGSAAWNAAEAAAEEAYRQVLAH